MPLPFGVRTLSWRMGRWRGTDTSLTAGETCSGARLPISVAGKRAFAQPGRATGAIYIAIATAVQASIVRPRANLDRCRLTDLCVKPSGRTPRN